MFNRTRSVAPSRHARAAALAASLVTAGAVAGDRIETMTVTASREPLAAEHAIGTLTVIDAAQLEFRQAVTVSDLLRRIPGFAHSRSGGLGTFTQMRVRGSESNHLLVMIDGIEANDPAIGSEFDFAHLLADGVESIEVLQGPQSALWGSDAVAGVVSVTTPSGSGPLSGSVFAEGGSFGTARVHGTAQAGSDAAGFFLTVGRVASDGTNISVTGGEDDGYRNTTASLKIDAAPLAGLGLQWVLRHTDADTDLDNFVPADANFKARVRQTYGGFRGDWQISDRWRLLARASYTTNDNANYEDGARSLATEGRRGRLALDLSRTFAKHHRLTLAAEREFEDFRQRSAFPGADQDQEETQYSGVLEYRGSLGSLDLQAALRYDDNESFEGAATWRLAAAYRFASATRLHLSYGRGIKNPTFTERFGFFPGSFVGNPNLEPEKSDSIEIGIDQRLADDRIRVQLSAYRDNLEDEINTVFSFPDFTATAVNANRESKRRGVELELDAALTEGLSLWGTYGWVDAEDGQSGDRREVRRPEHSGSVGARLAALDARLNVEMGVSFVGKQRDTDFSTFTPVTLDGYRLGHLVVRYTPAPMIEISARVENLFDENYQEVFGFATPGIGAYFGLRLTR